MPTRERTLSMGITGSGKSYQWLKLAESLLETGSIFRCLDTDNAITYMLDTQFPHLKPVNHGNVYVYPMFEWPEYKQALAWLMRKPIDAAILKTMDDELAKDHKRPIKDDDWGVVDMADNAWSSVQRYFTTEVFGADMGDYFLETRKQLHARGNKDAKGKAVSSIVPEALKGWTDWVVINKLYDDFILPIVYRLPCHVYMSTKVEMVDRGEKDAEIKMLFGDIGVRPSGQKKLGHQMHTIFLLIPGADKWMITTVKDRAGRKYFDKTPLISLHMQYLVAKAGWPIP